MCVMCFRSIVREPGLYRKVSNLVGCAVIGSVACCLFSISLVSATGTCCTCWKSCTIMAVYIRMPGNVFLSEYVHIMIVVSINKSNFLYSIYIHTPN